LSFQDLAIEKEEDQSDEEHRKQEQQEVDLQLIK
jgi:hypothetical protein